MDLWDSLFDADKQESRPEEKPLSVPESFPAFPYPTPYSIQTDFMKQLFQCIDQRKVGIFESPTGTGKSLSMICGAVSWLVEREKAEQQQIEEDQKEQTNPQSSKNGSKSGTNDSTPDWVQQHRALSDAAIERQEREQRRRELEERVERIRIREKKMRDNLARKMKRQAQGLAPGSAFKLGAGQAKKKKGLDSDEEDAEDAEFLVDDYHSDEENKRGGRTKGGDSAFGNVSKEVLELLKSFDQKESSHNARGKFGIEDEEPDVLKIYYCSRTHSQLSQFVDELRKTSYGEHLHVVSLGSRKSLCINEKFRQKSSSKPNRSADPVVSVNKLNDACLDAQKSGTPSNQRCEFLHTPTTSYSGGATGLSGSLLEAGESDEKILQFRDHALARVRDIEELAELGSELETCPYYGSRQTVRHCQLVTLPYNLLLHSSTRESLKLVIKDNILLLDEAHNLINSLLQMHSVTLTLQQVILAQDQLRVYLERYETRLSTVNEGYIRVLIRILTCLQQFITKWQTGGQEDNSSAKPSMTAGPTPLQPPSKPRPSRPADRVMRVNEFLHDSGVDHINLFKAHAYLETSSVARKLQGFHESLQRKEAKRLAKEQEKNVGSTPRGRVEIHRGKSVAFQKTGASLTAPSAPTTPVLLLVDAFLMSLLNADNDGRIILTLEEEATSQTESEDGSPLSTAETDSRTPGARKPVLKFMLLNPANVFKPLVEEARSVVLAGGTMEPVSDLLSHLFPYLKEDPAAAEPSQSLTALPQPSTQAISHYPRIHRFSCGHVIPRENLMTIVMEKAPTGTALELNFATRNLDQVMDSIGQSLVNVLNMIPDGVVVFFVSYSYMAQVLTRWGVKSGPTTTSILERIQAKKRVFVEPREATKADKMLKEYQDCILAHPEHAVAGSSVASGPRGAVLFSVVGGKMSEGINFSDRLGRGVVMVGMPFPNKGSAELQERMRYMDQVQEQELLQLRQKKVNALSTPSTPMTTNHASLPRMTAGSEYYENLCMRAVNQSIGRAIRHQGDYAVIVLMDRRYGTARIRKKLPGWIGSSIEVCEQFGPVVGKLAAFFKTKRTLALK
ncbi:chromosome transmission fidelity protein 1 [Entomortierella parvispora]|uniref:ATP-dependent DNA helicase CHL1 n=1 Tax=Entomortierella parvispora TaxID=205924 RepID=A0A9P3HG62_9FUNG|nr:chromosome transmission fidelity protein 1 [Entomortierella parvispora]